MTHRSRLSSFVLDCETDDLALHVEFWSRALGKRVDTLDEDGDGKYARLKTANDEPVLLLQKVTHPSRIHLDIETDDVEAEVMRLEELGARRVQQVHTWVVMEAPAAIASAWCASSASRSARTSTAGTERAPGQSAAAPARAASLRARTALNSEPSCQP